MSSANVCLPSTEEVAALVIDNGYDAPVVIAGDAAVRALHGLAHACHQAENIPHCSGRRQSMRWTRADFLQFGYVQGRFRR